MKATAWLALTGTVLSLVFVGYAVRVVKQDRATVVTPIVATPPVRKKAPPLKPRPAPVWTEADDQKWCDGLRACVLEHRYCDFAAYLKKLPPEGAEGGKACRTAVETEGAVKAKELERARDWAKAWDIWNALANLTGDETKYRAAAKRIDKRAVAKRRKDAAKAASDKREYDFAVSVDAMRRASSAPNGSAFWIKEAKYQRSIGGRYFTGKDWTYLLLYVAAENKSARPAHVNPHDFTVTFCGRDATHEMETYSLNYLDAVTLQPGSWTSGWLAFGVNRTCAVTLNYMGGGGVVSKAIAVR